MHLQVTTKNLAIKGLVVTVSFTPIRSGFSVSGTHKSRIIEFVIKIESFSAPGPHFTE